MPKIYSTSQAAKLIGVSLITVHRWLAAEKIKPDAIEIGGGRKLWRWTDKDIAAGRKLRALQKRGPGTNR